MPSMATKHLKKKNTNLSDRKSLIDYFKKISDIYKIQMKST